MSTVQTETAKPLGAARAGVVELRNLTKRYNPEGRPAVDGLSLTVPAGEVCVLIGPSGCGKTTALKMINRLIEPTSGEILIDGHVGAERNPAHLRREVGYVIQQVGLSPTSPWPPTSRRSRACSVGQGAHRRPCP